MAKPDQEKLVPPDVLQAKAEEVWTESRGEWGTPPGKPLESYSAMCVRMGIRGRAMSKRDRDRF